ncbi:class I SAM-dependent methyltransferase [Hyphomicrobium sp.]|uniref:class I SAM-dependent DNA methyltransferase n=1 Tax=Hyphomicrobium sp. TaxID=82 RepID=UPI003564E271
MTSDAADRIVNLYDRHAKTWNRERSRSLFEAPWLNRFLELVPPGGAILDIGCGSGEPIAGFFIRAGYRLHGIDSSPAMIALCKSHFPNDAWGVADMRTLSIGRKFNGLIAWDSFFHLRRVDQRRMFTIFRDHAASNAALMFTSGDSDGVAIGTYAGEPLYHASLAPHEYRALLDENGFDVVAHVFDDPNTGGHSIWLARLK